MQISQFVVEYGFIVVGLVLLLVLVSIPELWRRRKIKSYAVIQGYTVNKWGKHLVSDGVRLYFTPVRRIHMGRWHEYYRVSITIDIGFNQGIQIEGKNRIMLKPDSKYLVNHGSFPSLDVEELILQVFMLNYMNKPRAYSDGNELKMKIFTKKGAKFIIRALQRLEEYYYEPVSVQS